MCVIEVGPTIPCLHLGLVCFTEAGSAGEPTDTTMVMPSRSRTTIAGSTSELPDHEARDGGEAHAPWTANRIRCTTAPPQAADHRSKAPWRTGGVASQSAPAILATVCRFWPGPMGWMTYKMRPKSAPEGAPITLTVLRSIDRKPLAGQTLGDDVFQLSLLLSFLSARWLVTCIYQLELGAFKRRRQTGHSDHHPRRTRCRPRFANPRRRRRTMSSRGCCRIASTARGRTCILMTLR